MRCVSRPMRTGIEPVSCSNDCSSRMSSCFFHLYASAALKWSCIARRSAGRLGVCGVLKMQEFLCE